MIAAGTLRKNGSATVFKAKSASSAVPRYLFKVNCRKLQSIVKLRNANLQACVANPVGVRVFVPGARAMQASALFDELRNGQGELTGLTYLSTATCTN